MQPAIPIGTLLQNHYRIVQLLGQGGFGRTYLAEDQGRFNERCAIKEFAPTQGEDRFSDKATQLFQREASVLYQISHPQIPKFRATFEEAERLFLVQDYVDGPTYHAVLDQRRRQGKAFSEDEVRLFLQQVLPVLAHIHAKGIIHRDVSPDNIILRQQDQLPVLIDFGVVKEVVTRMHLDGVASPATTVGKAGYAPSEQMQTGRAYPSSDLYALAVTAVVLLTGQEPQALFDDINATWRWQDEVTVSPQLAAVLNKALSYRPGDRFQSVAQMAQALQAGGLESSLTGAALPSQMPLNQPPPTSQMRTVAVGRANPNGPPSNLPPSTVSNPTVSRPTTVRQAGSQMVMPSEREDRRSLLENPLAVGALAVGLATVAGFGGWAVVRSLDSAVTPTPTITSLPPLENTPTPTPTPTQATPKPVEYTQQPLELEPGVTKTVEGNMRGGDTVTYPLSAQAGQTLTVDQSREGVLLSVLGPNGEPVDSRAERVRSWEGVLEEGGDYQIQMRPVEGLSSSDYSLDVTLSAMPEPVEPDPDVTAPPNGEPQPPTEPPVQLEVLSQRVSFPAGSDGVLVANQVSPGQVRRYVVNVQEGQILRAQITDAQGPATFDVLEPSGNMVADASGIVYWEGFTQFSGDYVIDVVANQSAEFTLEIQASAQLPAQ
jgi:serine/threonine protein kinase